MQQYTCKRYDNFSQDKKQRLIKNGKRFYEMQSKKDVSPVKNHRKLISLTFYASIRNNFFGVQYKKLFLFRKFWGFFRQV